MKMFFKNQIISYKIKMSKCKSCPTDYVEKTDKDGNLQQKISKDGYCTVKLVNDDNEVKTFFVHDLVAMSFIGPCPKGHKVHHIDGNKTNNYVKNLKYVKAK
jgi:hypothetical protein